MRSIVTEDEVTLVEGDRAFDYYGMKWGVIGTVDTYGWFDFIHDDSTRSTLNGERIATFDPRTRNKNWPVAS